ncbi:hypothetical protein [Mucilaginibacter sp.]|uniref:hypothetical protein n=1 Tax=Mucilaginibacter sp. TaxID=1882438 RepID=UPI0035BBC018
MKLKYFLLITALIFSNYIKAQSPALQSYVPLSPNASGLGVYGNIPVSLYTGTPNISVPIYDMKSKDLDFPISLNYHADGLKILGEATFVGLDWTLSNTGVITRSVNFLDDFSDVGFFRHPPSDKKAGNGIDAAPDIFCYNFNGRTGKFIIDYPGTIRFLRKEDDIRIALDANGNFLVTMEDGAIYSFQKRENQVQTIVINSISGTQTVNRNYVTAWYLSSITSARGEVATFNYASFIPKVIQDLTTSTGSKSTSLSFYPQTQCFMQNYYQVYNQYYQQYNNTTTVNTHVVTEEVLLDNIVYTGGRVQFNYNDRIDLQNDLSGGNILSKKLTEIIIFNSRSDQVKKLVFSYDYFDALNGMPDYKAKRLRLQGIKEINYTGTLTTNPYSFVYNLDENSVFPPKVDNVEAYGYYSNDPTIGMLSKIKYPTAGSTTFFYEKHDLNGVYGARIQKTETRDSHDELLSVKKYDYTMLNENGQIVSSGKAMGNRIYSINTVGGGIYTCTNSGESWSSNTNITVNYKLFSSQNFLPLGNSATGSPYGYDQVSVLDGLNGENGKSTYYYYNVPDLTAGDINIPSTHDQNDGLLLREEHYLNTGSSTFSLQKKVVYTLLTRDQVSISAAAWSTLNRLQYAIYNIFTQNIVNTKEETWIYEGNGTLSNIVNYTYNSGYLQPTSKEIISSEGKSLKTIKRFAYDMVALGQTTPYQNMVSKNMLNQIIEEENQVNGVKVSKTVNEYSQNWSNPSLILPKYIKTQKYAGPLETRVQYVYYDYFGNPITLSFFGGPLIGYRWGYNNTYAIAQCKNAGGDEFYYEGFEESSLPGVTIGTFVGGSGSGPHTGRFYMSQPFTISWSPPTNRNFVLSYWYKSSGSNWTYSGELPYTGNSFALPNGINYDDIRIYPKDSEMSTFTYQQGVGLSSSTDSKGKTAYFEYDDFKRLLAIKDQYGNIVKAYQYNLIDQSQIWQDVSGETRCAIDGFGNSTGEQLQKQVDVNPVSATYNKFQWRSLGMTGTCPITFKMLNNSNSGFTVTFTGNGSNINFAFPAGADTSGLIPPGTYNLVVSPSGNAVSKTMYLGQRNAVTAPGQIFNNVIVSMGSTDLSLKIQN